jgi:predicted nucleic acid-binding protein
MSVYRDASVLIAYLYKETDDPAKAQQAERFFKFLRAENFQGVIAFYSLSELYGYTISNYSEEKSNEIFRFSLVNLFSFPLIVKPFVDRTEAERLRRRFTLTDSTDIPHVVAALAFGCSAIITFDHHFQQVRELIPVYTPDEYLATLQESENE